MTACSTYGCACSAYGCTNRPSEKIAGITFHRFPQNAKRRIAWVRAVGRKNWIPSQCAQLCSEHFSEDQIDRTQSSVRLKENAMPNIFKSFPTHPQQTIRLPKAHKDHVTQGISKEKPVLCEPGTNNNCVKHSASELELIRKLNEAEQKGVEYRKKIKTLLQSKRRHEKIICNLKALLKDLDEKETMNIDDPEVLSQSILTPCETFALAVREI